MSQPTYRDPGREGLHGLLRRALHHLRRAQCEPLHGHNYRAAVALEGPLDENAYVFDFTRFKRALKAVVDRLDHRMLLPTKSALDPGAQTATRSRRRYRDKRYVFPPSDVVLLPIPNTTAEMLAWWIAQELRQGLGDAARRASPRIEVEVDESFGQRAFYREALGGAGRGQAGARMTSPSVVYLGLGSNLGDRQGNLAEAHPEPPGATSGSSGSRRSTRPSPRT